MLLIFKNERHFNMFKWIKYFFIKNEEAVNAKMATDAIFVEGHIKKEIAKAKTNLEKLHFAKLQSETEIKKVDKNIQSIDDLLESEKTSLKKKLKDLSEEEAKTLAMGIVSRENILNKNKEIKQSLIVAKEELNRNIMYLDAQIQEAELSLIQARAGLYNRDMTTFKIDLQDFVSDVKNRCDAKINAKTSISDKAETASLEQNADVLLKSLKEENVKGKNKQVNK